jgi:hypothetical protein
MRKQTGLRSPAKDAENRNSIRTGGSNSLGWSWTKSRGLGRIGKASKKLKGKEESNETNPAFSKVCLSTAGGFC